MQTKSFVSSSTETKQSPKTLPEHDHITNDNIPKKTTQPSALTCAATRLPNDFLSLPPPSPLLSYLAPTPGHPPAPPPLPLGFAAAAVLLINWVGRLPRPGTGIRHRGSLLSKGSVSLGITKPSEVGGSTVGVGQDREGEKRGGADARM